VPIEELEQHPLPRRIATAFAARERGGT